VLVAGAAAVDIGESLFWIWLSKRRKATMGAEALVGRTAEVVRPCRPLGLVRLEGELWQARCEGGADRGQLVSVAALDGLILLVERE
jgi:membrane protein implicated in regulation of membrane protease activity